MAVLLQREGLELISADELMALAGLAGRTIVTAAATDAWESVRGKIARLLGCGDAERTKVAESRLEQTREQLSAAGADEERVHAALADRWTGRVADLLEDVPGIDANLRALVDEIRASLPAGQVLSSDHSVAVGGDMSVSASGGAMAAAVIHGNVAPPGPTVPGSVNG